MQDAKLVKDLRPISLIGCIYKIVTKGLKINIHKSKLMGVGLSKEEVDPAARVFALEIVKDATVAGKFLDFSFSSSFRKYPRGGVEKSQFDMLCSNLDDVTLPYSHNRWVWNLDPNGDFSVKSVRDFIDNLMLPNEGVTLNESLTLSHFFYANDVVFMGKWEVSNISAIVNVLNIFHMASGLKINIHKSKLMGVGVSKEEVDSAARYVGCSTFTPFNYLGITAVPMGVLNNMEAIRRNFLNGVEKADQRFAGLGGKRDKQYNMAIEIMNIIIPKLMLLIQKKQEEKQIQKDQAANTRYWKILAYYDDDDDYNFPITLNETVDSLNMGDKHLDTVPATESDKFIKSSVENLVPNPSESEGENGCDMPACFTTFSNILFDAEYEFNSIDNQSLHNETFRRKSFRTLCLRKKSIL
nr:RNA-directed DNA polymerase, eukaryota, reverse transcriptase zinc-binding domain protein [Tanacetum cinerariifolium]